MAVEPVQGVRYKVNVNAEPELSLPEVDPVNGKVSPAEGRQHPNDLLGVRANDATGNSPSKNKLELQYAIEDVPPWYMCITLGFQHYLTMFGATLAIPLLMTPALCIGDDGVGKSEIIGTIFFISGLVTLLQGTLGIRLPIVQGGTFAFLTPVFAILRLEQWKCPDVPDSVANDTTWVTNVGQNWTTMAPRSSEEMLAWRREEWQLRMREIQGAIIVASLVQVLIGCSGAIGIVLRFIGPLAICPTITLIGLSLFEDSAMFCSKQWGVALMTMALIVMFSQYFRKIKVPCFYKPFRKPCTSTKSPIFQLFPVVLAVVLAWLICLILTYSGALGQNPSEPGYGARTDTRLDVIQGASWFRIPYPGQWGLPTVSVSGAFGMMAGVLAGMLESIGDYYACARFAGAPPPPVHAINRGIAMEGFGCVLAGIFGTGSGTTSYSENIGAIGITQVASRRVIQTGAFIMILLGMLGKFGALFITIPDPIIGGVFMVMFGMITAVGISNLQYVDLNSSRNLFVFGFSIFFGLSLPIWIKKNEGVIATNNDVLDQIITVLLSTSMFVGGFVGFVLDNTIPGTAEERGIDIWRKHTEEAEGADDTTGSHVTSLATYDFPIGMGLIRRWGWTKYVPICPTFLLGGATCCKRKKPKTAVV